MVSEVPLFVFLLKNKSIKGRIYTIVKEETKYIFRINWNDNFLRAQYYKDLKDIIKNKIVRSNRLENLRFIMEIAIRIDNYIYERILEYKGYYELRKSKVYF
ncbi:Zinc finger CCHC-type protein [Rutstroemia sp. NJR-2017a BBW]|nr:Zinc finger CCHC-type protein [Rutstroemia sp. NJR-2017a BBW]